MKEMGYFKDAILGNGGRLGFLPVEGESIVVRPDVQASALVSSTITGTSMKIDWTRGNGSRCVVFVKAGNSGTAAPVDGDTYTANTAFGSGTQIGTSGWYCVYNGTGTTVNVTGLTANTAYRVMVCEYNGSAGNETYKSDTATGNPANQTTSAAAAWIEIFADVFTEGGSNVDLSDHTPNTGTSWRKRTSTEAITVNATTDKAQKTDAGRAIYTFSPDSTANKVRFDFDFTSDVLTDTTIKRSGLILAFDNAALDSILCRYDTQNNALEIATLANLTANGTVIASLTGLASFSSGSTYNLFVEYDFTTGAISFTLTHPDTSTSTLTHTTSFNLGTKECGVALAAVSGGTVTMDNFTAEEHA